MTKAPTLSLLSFSFCAIKDTWPKICKKSVYFYCIIKQFFSLCTYHSGWMSCMISFVRASQAVRNGKRVKSAKWTSIYPAGIKPTPATWNERQSCALDRLVIALRCLNVLKTFTVLSCLIKMNIPVTKHLSNCEGFNVAMRSSECSNY